MQRISNMLPQAYKDDEDELEFCYTRAIEN